jgi:glyoxylate reductase
VPRVLVTHQLPDGGARPLLAAGVEVLGGIGRAGVTHDELLDLAPQVDGIVCSLNDTLDESVLRAGTNGRLRVVATVSVGSDHIDLSTADALGVAVCNTPGVLDESTADLAFLLILGASRLAWEAELELREGRWAGWDLTHRLGLDVHGSVLGLVGYGRIARAVARRALGFGMTVLHHARHHTGLEGYVASLDDLLPLVDVLSVHVPLTAQTRHLIGATELARLKPTAVVVNTARGPVVDEDSLADALEAGRLFGVGLDVFDHEPVVNPRLLAAPRTVLLPHIGSATAATRLRMAELACQGVCDALAGAVPSNLVTRC